MNAHPFRRKRLAEIVVETPATVPVFRKYKLDFCCGGDSILEDAAKDSGVDENILFSELDQVCTLRESPVDISDMAELCRIIETRYHQKHRDDLPELICLSNKVETVHRKHSNCPKGATALLLEIRDEMLYHMKEEETDLFPVIREGETTCSPHVIYALEEDHAGLGEKVRRLESMFAAESLPDDACTTWRALARGIEEFITELMEHIHLENNVLFPNVTTSLEGSK